MIILRRRITVGPGEGFSSAFVSALNSAPKFARGEVMQGPMIDSSPHRFQNRHGLHLPIVESNHETFQLHGQNHFKRVIACALSLAPGPLEIANRLETDLCI